MDLNDLDFGWKWKLTKSQTRDSIQMEFDVKWVNDWMEKALKKIFFPHWLLSPFLCTCSLRHALPCTSNKNTLEQLRDDDDGEMVAMMLMMCDLWWFWFELQSQISVPLVRRVDRGRESMRRTTRSAILCFHLTLGEFPATPKNYSFYATVMFGFWLTGSSMVIDSFRFIHKRCKSTLIS